LKTKRLLFTLFVLSIFSNASAQVDLMTEFSLFYEAYKNKDYHFAYEHGFTVINADPSTFIKYKPFKKMEEVILQLRDSIATSEEEVEMYSDTLFYLYDKAIELGAKNPEYFILQKAYRTDIWDRGDVEEKIAAYVYAFEKDPGADSYYKDKLGILYSQNMTEENGYKMKAFDLYTALVEANPEDGRWPPKIIALAGNIDQLIDILKLAWDIDPENLEKAYKYAETCIQAEEFEKALEPLLFLTQKSPDVINYWRKQATIYNKLENHDEAINSYKTLIELEPNNRENFYNIALIYKNIGQLSVCRSYLQKSASASDESWDIPIMVEAQLYEQAARECGFEFMDKCVYQLAVDTYKRAADVGGAQSSSAKDRVKALGQSVPQSEDYFFRKFKSGDKIQIEGKCYGWIQRSIIVP
jgi:hypothetical protein